MTGTGAAAPPLGRDPDWIVPDWHLPNVGALMTTRAGATSGPPFDSFDRARLDDALGGALPVWLRQVHGTQVVAVRAADAGAPARAVADASFATEPGVACAVQVADCMPVLFAAPHGVAAAHAGWRGLAGGVLEATVQALCAATGDPPERLRVWLGPCIGPDRFQVGADVLEAFGVDPARTQGSAFRVQRPGKWLGDLPRLARERLAAAGVARVTGGTWCTVSDPSRFFSFRRDGSTGRMAALVWLRG